MKGLLVFYVNTRDGNVAQVQTQMDLFLKSNDTLIKRIQDEMGYQIMLVPTQNEACRIEKIEFDKPFPRYALPHIDLAESDKMMERIHKATGEE